MARKGKFSTIRIKRNKDIKANGTINQSKLSKGQLKRYKKAVTDREFRESEENRKPRTRRLINGIWVES